MTRSERKHEVGEFLGARMDGKGQVIPTKIQSGLGYNRRRAYKAMAKAEAGGRSLISQARMKKLSSAGLANRVLKVPQPVRLPTGLAGLGMRAIKQRGLRGGVQNIPRMASAMRKDPSKFPPVVTLSPDSRAHGKETVTGGRTRTALAATVGRKPEAITLPSQRYASSARRYRQARLSGKIGSKPLPGQDPRLAAMSNKELKNLRL